MIGPHRERDLGIDYDRVAAFVARQRGPGTHQVHLDMQALRGGLEAAAIARVHARALDAAGRPHSSTFVVKRLEDVWRREGAVYQAVLAPMDSSAAPRLLDTEDVTPEVTYLYLEYIRPSRVWPWMDAALSGLALEQVAQLHSDLPITTFAGAVPLWDYETDLRESAGATLELFERAVAHEDLIALRAARPALRRLVSALPAVRQALVAAAPFAVAVLHGDLHSGNVMIRSSAGSDRAVLLDWGRARVGTPLEDVSSWLQSLGYWEPEARRRHDTLLRRYLAARGVSTHLGRELRDAYWLASACNVLAGALRYYLSIADGWGATSSRARADAARAARDHLRVVRRADAVWRR